VTAKQLAEALREPLMPQMLACCGMHSPSRSVSLRVWYGLPLTLSGVLVALFVAGLTGCASPGSPRPPSLRLPSPPRGLRAERVGPEVRLAWETPADTTDDDAIRFTITAVVCREASIPVVSATRAGVPRTGLRPRGSAANPRPSSFPCLPVRRMTVSPGETQMTDRLDPSLLAASDTLLRYRVTLLNASGRSANAAEALAAAGPAPAPVTSFHVVSSREGALLTWQSAAPPPGEPVSRMEIRREGGGSTGSNSVASSLQATARPGGSVSHGRKPAPSGATSAETVLFADVAAGTPDAGGMVDRSVRLPQAEGLAFTYVAQRVRTVQLGGNSLELHGLPSPTVTFTWRDTFAPSPPAGLASIPSLAPPSIDLSWEPGFDAGLVGYNIYRADLDSPPGTSTSSGSNLPGSRFVRLNSEPVPVASYRDLAVIPGRSYRYRVTAVGAHDLESAPGPVQQETVR
jgi:hypothetical protein